MDGAVGEQIQVGVVAGEDAGAGELDLARLQAGFDAAIEARRRDRRSALFPIICYLQSLLDPTFTYMSFKVGGMTGHYHQVRRGWRTRRCAADLAASQAAPPTAAASNQPCGISSNISRAAGVDVPAATSARAVLLMDHEGDIDEALARGHALAAEHPESVIAHRVVGDLRYAAAIHAAGGDKDDNEDARKLAAGIHLRVARDALLVARRLAPNCVDSEFRRAQSIPCPVDPANNNAAYGMYGEEAETTAAERVEEARERARRSYARMTVKELVPLAVERVLDAARQSGAAEGRKHGKRVAEAFPNLACVQYLNAYMDLEFVRGLDASIDRRAFLRRTLTIAERASQAFPRSAVIASFLAQILFVLGEYDSAERECCRALSMKEPDDPEHDCIPPGSISGENRGARLVSLACEFHELLNRILVVAKDYWDSMSSERQDGFLSVRLDVL
ncbi:hypothetical protein PR202_ga22013 [Eleusine coracana subsp. coracana]|uniref:Uncharacterized protein n=1 Tax=Eleusine coracana subsp. coracana TaxID=191504 RepID=A0AAV5D2X9_ELECO|nr:hypothetical protein PR202_ga22013 [Eleusine coracana subsp. coracana]